jgi:L-iditol 2-dehydrogenase
VAENVLSDGGEVGFEHPGGYGEYLLTEATNLHPLPKDFSLSTAALIEPLAVCVRALRRLRLEDRRWALIFGDGSIGLLMLLLLKRAGLERIALVGGRPARLDLAREFGASVALNYHDAEADLADAVAGLPGAPFPIVVEASGSARAVEAATVVAQRQGKILLLGDYGVSRAVFPWNHAVHRELELIGSCASAGAWPEAVRLAGSGALPLERLISRRLPASSFAEAIEFAKNSRDVVKVVMEWTVCE